MEFVGNSDERCEDDAKPWWQEAKKGGGDSDVFREAYCVIEVFLITAWANFRWCQC